MEVHNYEMENPSSNEWANHRECWLVNGTLTRPVFIDEKWCADFVVLFPLFEMNNERMVVNNELSKPTVSKQFHGELREPFSICIHDVSSMSFLRNYQIPHNGISITRVDQKSNKTNKDTHTRAQKRLAKVEWQLLSVSLWENFFFLMINCEKKKPPNTIIL